jgi:hypothetical protein
MARVAAIRLGQAVTSAQRCFEFVGIKGFAEDPRIGKVRRDQAIRVIAGAKDDPDALGGECFGDRKAVLAGKIEVEKGGMGSTTAGKLKSIGHAVRNAQDLEAAVCQDMFGFEPDQRFILDDHEASGVAVRW